MSFPLEQESFEAAQKDLFTVAYSPLLCICEYDSVVDVNDCCNADASHHNQQRKQFNVFHTPDVLAFTGILQC